MPASAIPSAPAVSAGVDFSQYTKSAAIIAQLQAQYGTMLPGQLQANRKQFWSYLTYPLLGSNQLNFFGQAVGNAGATLEDTNLPVQASFGTSSFLIQGIECSYKLFTYTNTVYDGTDANSLASDVLGGFFNAGELELQINAKLYLQILNPFLQAPPADGRAKQFFAGAASVTASQEPVVNLASRSQNKWLTDDIFVAAQQNFQCTINYPNGAIPVRATGIVTNASVPLTLRVGVLLDGFEFRPVQ